MADAILSAERLRELLHYDPETGVFARKVRASQQPAGARADIAMHGKRSIGYRCIKVRGHRFMAHRIAWAMHYGEWPGGCVDHINGDRSDNRIDNLRVVSAALNSQNQRSPHANSKTGVMGVHRDKQKFRAKITVGGVTVNLGSFDSVDEAHATYLKAKRSMHPGNLL